MPEPMRILPVSIFAAVGVAAVAGAVIACVVQQAPAASDPTTVATVPVATATTAPTATSDAATIFVGTVDASAAPSTSAVDASHAEDAASATATADAGSAAPFQACAMDSDCVSVARVGCCNNGYREAVNAAQVDAYKRSFTCPPPRPMCPMFMINDNRDAECNNGTHLCELVAVEKIACGGFIKNQHRCPTGFHCQLPKTPDVPGTCVK